MSAQRESRNIKNARDVVMPLAFLLLFTEIDARGEYLTITDVLLCRDAPMGLEGYCCGAVTCGERECEGQALKAALRNSAVGVGMVLCAVYGDDTIALYRCGVGRSKSHSVALTTIKNAGLQLSIGKIYRLAA